MAVALQSVMPQSIRPAAEAAKGERWVIPLILVQVLCTAAILPVAGHPGPELPALTPFFLSGILTAELATSFLLFAWFHDIRSWPLLLVASAYLFSTALLVDYLLTFPSAILPDRVFLGGQQSAAWTFIIWNGGFAGLTLAAALLQWHGIYQDRGAAWARSAAQKSVVAVGLAALLTLVVASHTEWLPSLMDDGGFTLLDQCLDAISLIMLMACIVIILLHIRKQSELFAWLSVALVGMFCANLLTALGGARYTVGWSAARLSWVASASVMFMFFVRQFVRRQRVLVDMRQLLEESVAQRTADLTEIIRQRDLLLREVYHRVKNNLQVVDALVTMERQRLDDATAREALSALRNRVFALGLVHQQLMSSEDLETFPMAPFLRELCDNVVASLALGERPLRVEVDVAPIRVNLDFAIPVALLTTELLSNAAKRPLATEVHISLHRGQAGFVVLAVEDNDSEEPVPPLRRTGKSDTSGRIIEGLTRQLGGEMDVTRDAGLQIRIRMPLPDAAA